MARELSRLQKAGADPLEALRCAFEWTADRFEFGATHAQAGADDWLMLRDDYAATAEERPVSLVEVVGHLAWASLRDRESVVHGTRVPVRVDLGGRRIVKKQTINTVK